MLVIKSNDIILRKITLTKKDVLGYLECHKDEDAKKNFKRIPRNLNEAKNELKRKHANTFVIETDGKFAGFINLDLTDDPTYKHSANIGYGIHKDFRGRGLATKAVKSITEYGFKKLKLVRISGMCRTFNKASARVLEKAGYKLEGILVKNKFKDGKYLDDMIWAKTR